MKRLTPEEVEREIVALDTMDITALQERWRQLYRVEPPFKIRSGFLRRAIAYRLQELAFGGLSSSNRRQLQKFAAQLREHRNEGSSASVPQTARSRVTLSPGTQLMREWNGTTMIVDVVDGGFIWRGGTHRTLSAVAVAITGTKWSGPKFFGLRTGGRRAGTGNGGGLAAGAPGAEVEASP